MECKQQGLQQIASKHSLATHRAHSKSLWHCDPQGIEEHIEETEEENDADCQSISIPNHENEVQKYAIENAHHAGVVGSLHHYVGMAVYGCRYDKLLVLFLLLGHVSDDHLSTF